MRRRTFVTAAGAAVAMLPVRGSAQVAQRVTIGVNVPLSGPYASYGNDVVRGAQAAVDETNRIALLPIQRFYAIRTFDDQNSPAIATTNVSIAQADITVIAMIGNLTANVTLAALPQYATSVFPLVVPTITADSITAQGFRNIFRLATKDSSEGRLFARAVLQGRKRLVARAIVMEGAYGADVASGFVAQARADHHDADAITFASGTLDPAMAAKTILDASPEYVFLCGRPDIFGPVAEAMRLAGYRGEF